ncbi:hypothetical protein L218DRAFT_657063 [Marasmius fiardii PR-910]|nr:hypothetical protein L218DRAFT_657063 [Marasmius fiardii PR-910]
MPKCQPHYPNPEDTRNYGKAPAPQIEVSMAHVLTCWKPIRRPSGVQRRRRQRRPLCLRHFLFRKVTVAVTLVLSQSRHHRSNVVNVFACYPRVTARPL